MKKLYICTVVLVLMGCIKREGLIEDISFIGNNSLEVHIEESANSRTIVDENNRVLWVKNDQIGVFGEKDIENIPFTLSKLVDDGTSALFTGNLPDGDLPSIAYYPYNEDADMEGNKLCIPLPYEYEFTDNSNAPMIGIKQGDKSFMFKHLCGLLRFTVEDLPSDVEKLVITSDGENAPCISGNAVVEDFSVTSPCLEIENGQGGHSITINLDDRDTNTYKFNIPLPVGEYPLLTFTFYLKDGSEYFSNSIHGCLIRRATILNLGDPSIKRNGNYIITDSGFFDGIYIGSDRSFWTYINDEKSNLPEQMYIVLPSVAETGSIESFITFNDQGLPNNIATTDFSLKFFNIKEKSFDVYVITDDLTYCLRNVVTEEAFFDKQSRLGVVEERNKLEANKLAFNSLKVITQGIKSCLDMLSSTTELPKQLLEFSSDEGTIPMDLLKRNFDNIDEYVNSFHNFVFNRVEEKNELYISSDVFEKSIEIKDLLNVDIDIIKKLEEEGVDFFIENFESQLDKLEHDLYKWEQMIIEWENLDKNSLSVITEDAGAITFSSANLNGRIKGNYQMEDKCGFFYSDGQTRKIVNAKIRELINAEIDNLSPNTTYYYNAFYTPARYNFTMLGEQKSFTTQEISVITGNAEEKTMNSAVVYGKEVGGWDAHQILFDLGICYSSTCNNPTLDNCEGHVYAPKGTSGEFSVVLEGLRPNTKYYYRAFMVVDNYPVFYGHTTYFITPSNTSNVKALTLNSENVTANSVSIYGQITNWDEDLMGVIGFYYSSKDSDPKTGGTEVYSLSSSSENFTVKEKKISYRGNLNNLTPNTTYYYRAFVAVNNVVEPILGEVKSFKTSEGADAEIRRYLTKFYNDTDGDNWVRNDNWCSDKPISLWYGIRTESDDMFSIIFKDNNLKGNIDLSGCPYLWSFWISGNNSVESIDISNCVNLAYFDIKGETIKEFSVANCTNLLDKQIVIGNCKNLKRVDFSGCTSILSFSTTVFDINNISQLDLSGCSSLQRIHIPESKMESISLKGCSALTSIKCFNGLLSNIDFSDCKNLKEIMLRDNKLTDIDISNCTNLQSLDVLNNNIKKEISKTFDDLPIFVYDKRYQYTHDEFYVTDEWIEIPTEGYLRCWYKDLGNGWWYPGEPLSGKHDWTE